MSNHMISLVSMSNLRYDRKDLQPGDEFQATKQHAVILIGLGRAELADGNGSYLNRSMTSEKPGKKPRGKRGKYNRRDMVNAE